ncbi:MAG: hypothetical protein E7437_06415 [Ruminococcaceae bacterium]|nr:hypothetical protein [Oscillospiraceae bacterium]
MKILHTADWHLDAPMEGDAGLRRELAGIPRKIAALCKNEGCDLMIIAGDLFDGLCSRQTLEEVMGVLEELALPVIITPGNHDFCGENSPYLTETWPENVHIFTQPQITELVLPELDCRIYGAGYTSMDCPGLLKGFRAQGPEQWQIGVLHGEVVAGSAYCPMTRAQIKETELDYLALGHVHKGGSLQAGKTVCVWPGCPMGRGFDETGEKGVVITQLGGRSTFVPLDTTRFYDEQVDADGDPAQALAAALPALPTRDHYRITLTGYSPAVQLDALTEAFPHVPNLTLRDETIPQVDIWSSAGEDSLEGAFFQVLRESAQSTSQSLQHRAELAARISRRLLDGQEVTLP